MHTLQAHVLMSCFPFVFIFVVVAIVKGGFCAGEAKNRVEDI